MFDGIYMVAAIVGLIFIVLSLAGIQTEVKK